MHHVGVHATAIVDAVLRAGSLHALNELDRVAKEADSQLWSHLPQEIPGDSLNHAPIPVAGWLSGEKARRSRCSLFFDYFLKIFLAVSRCRPPGIPLPPSRSSGAVLERIDFNLRRPFRIRLPRTSDEFTQGKGIWLEAIPGCHSVETLSRCQRDKHSEAAQLGHVLTGRPYLPPDKPRDAT